MKKIFIENDIAVVPADKVELFDDFADVDVTSYDPFGNPENGTRYLCFNKNSTILEVEALPSPWVPHAYKLEGNELILDEKSPAWKEYCKSLKGDIPKEVTMRQARRALFDRGILNNVSAAISTLPSPDKEIAQIEWEFSSTVERSRPITQMIGAALGLDSDELDDLFIEASKL